MVSCFNHKASKKSLFKFILDINVAYLYNKNCYNIMYRVYIVELNLYVSKYSVFLGVFDAYKLKSLLKSLYDDKTLHIDLRP